MNDLREILNRDPCGYSKGDLETIVEELRASRHQYNLGNKKAGSTKPKTEKQKEIGGLKLELDLDL
jgi:hypothetical protein